MSGNQLHVTKRDGTTEVFEMAKLRRSIAAAMRDCGYDEAICDPLARAVKVHLDEIDRSKPATTEYIFRCVRSVLQQTGLEDVSQELSHKARLRDRARRSIRVVGSDIGRRNSVAWRKRELVTNLMERYELRRSVSRYLAGQVEQRVFALNYRLVSKTLLAELVKNEVMAWGLSEPVTSAPAPSITAAPVSGSPKVKES